MNEPPIVRPVLQPTHDLLQQLADEQRTTNQILQSMDITLGKLTHTNSQLLTTIANNATSATRSVHAIYFYVAVLMLIVLVDGCCRLVLTS
jgi:hypothetical protein